MASIANPGILTETSASLLNNDTGNSPSTRKRKRDDSGDLRVLQQFTIKPHPSSKFDKPLSLIPLFSIPRNSLALSFLDAEDDSLSMGQGRLFSATRTMLDLILEAAGGQLVLIVRLIANGKLYAVERVEAGIYALCRFGSWVAEENIRALQRQSTTSPSQSQSIPPTQLPAAGGVLQWWHSTKIETRNVHPESNLDGRRPRTKGLLKICANDTTMNRRTVASSNFSGELMRHARDMNAISEAPNPLVELVDTSFSKQTPQDVFEKVRQQYLETLYISKSSVAYFAKGPLTRARVACASEEPTELKTREFVEYLRAGILTLKKLDQKYKDALPNLLKHFTSGVQDGQDGELPPPKKRKSKKRRMGNNGMYPDEDEFVAHWWKGRSISNPVEPIGASHESECKRLLAGLRLRETQLQTLIILEVMGLEQLIRPTDTSELDRKDASTEVTASTTKPRRKNPKDLRSLLDLLLDRLCIWQSVSVDQEVSPEKPGSLKTERKVRKEGDVLRDFCVEVIVPFYASRLPDCCKAISRKLGGLSTTSPTRPPLAKAASTSQVLPGTTMRRERRDQARRPLQRVLTDEKATSHLRPPSLTRSNTAPPNRLIKREESESSQALQLRTRGGIQKAKRTDNREVDLDAIAKQHEAKLRKMNALKQQKKELDDAISALRKPNRTLVSKDFVDTAVQRTVINSRKPRNPVRNPAGIGVQVTATPKINRKRDVHVGSRSRHAQTVRTQTHSPNAQPPELLSSETHIPSSVFRHGFSQVGTNSQMTAANAQSRMHERSLCTVHETPSRGSSRQSDPLGLKQEAQPGKGDDLPLSLPLLSRLPKASDSSFRVPDHPLHTPRASRQRLLSDTSTSHRQHMNQNNSTLSQQSRRMLQTSLKTPIKRGFTAIPNEGEEELTFIPASSPPMLSRPHSAKDNPLGGKSIFEALGWDNYDDDLDELA